MSRLGDAEYPIREDNVFPLDDDLSAHLQRLDALSASSKDFRGDTRERLLDAAIEQFSENGFDGTSVRTLSSAVGITPAGLYSHFESKEAVLRASMARAYAVFLRFVYRVREGQTPDVDLDIMTLCRRHMHFQVEYQHTSAANDRLLNIGVAERFIDEEALATLRAAQRFYVGHVRRAIARYRGPSELDASLEAEAILALCDSVAIGPRVKPPLDVEELIGGYLLVISRVLGR